MVRHRVVRQRFDRTDADVRRDSGAGDSRTLALVARGGRVREVTVVGHSAGADLAAFRSLPPIRSWRAVAFCSSRQCRSCGEGARLGSSSCDRRLDSSGTSDRTKRRSALRRSLKRPAFVVRPDCAACGDGSDQFHAPGPTLQSCDKTEQDLLASCHIAYSCEVYCSATTDFSVGFSKMRKVAAALLFASGLMGSGVQAEAATAFLSGRGNPQSVVTGSTITFDPLPPENWSYPGSVGFVWTGGTLTVDSVLSGQLTTLEISFSIPVAAFAFNWGAGFPSWKLSAYDDRSNRLGSYDLPIGRSSNAGDFVGIASTSSNISYARLAVPDDGDWISIDNFTFGDPATPVAAVPEPSTWALMLLGFVGLGLAGYRRSRRRTA